MAERPGHISGRAFRCPGSDQALTAALQTERLYALDPRDR